MTKNQHGGSRTGAGAKPLYPGVETQRVETTLPKSVVEKADRLAKYQKITRPRLLAKIITDALGD